MMVFTIQVPAKIDDIERQLIEHTLSYYQGNKVRAAPALGISLKTLYNKLNRYQGRTI